MAVRLSSVRDHHYAYIQRLMTVYLQWHLIVVITAIPTPFPFQPPPTKLSISFAQEADLLAVPNDREEQRRSQSKAQRVSVLINSI